jgi:hypothetical protein
MPIRKIEEKEPEICRSTDHKAPNMMALPPGLYEHECPQCGEKTQFRVGNYTL